MSFFLKALVLLSMTVCDNQLAQGKYSVAPYFVKPNNRPILIAMRGSMGEYPENSPLAITDAFQAGVDFIAVELHLSKDGQIVIFSDKKLNTLTNVADFPEFAERQATKEVDWLTNSFDLTELK